MDIQTFLAIGIVGLACSLLVEAITRYYATKPLISKLVSVGVCLVIGTGFYFGSHATWWASFLGVLASASTVYSFVFNSNTSSTTDR